MICKITRIFHTLLMRGLIASTVENALVKQIKRGCMRDHMRILNSNADFAQSYLKSKDTCWPMKSSIWERSLLYARYVVMDTHQNRVSGNISNICIHMTKDSICKTQIRHGASSKRRKMNHSLVVVLYHFCSVYSRNDDKYPNLYNICLNLKCLITLNRII